MNSPTQRLLRNVFSNWAQMVLSAVIAFFLSPFVVHTLGTETYGIWALVFSIVAYLNLFDAGMKQSLARFLSKHYATKDYTALNEVISTSTFIYTITGSIVVIGTVLVASFFLDSFNIPPDMLPIMRKALVIVGVNQAIAFFFMTGTAIGPFHRYDISNAIEIAFSFINAGATVYVLKAGYGLIGLAWVVIAGNFARFLIRRYTQQMIVPQIRLRIHFIKKERMRELLGYGAISFLIVVSWMVIFNIDNIVIGLYLTTSAVAYYSIATQVINYTRAIVNAIGIPLVPAISHIDATSGTDEIAPLYLKLSNYLYFLTTAICVGLMFFGDDFIILWMGPEFTSTVTVMRILTIPLAVFLPQVMANSVLLGIGKHRALFYVLAGEAVSNFLLSIILVQHYGVVGVAIGTGIPQVVIYLFVYPMVFHRIIKASLKTYYMTNARLILIGTAITLPISLLMNQYNSVGGWLGFFINISVLGLISLAGFWAFVLDQEMKSNILKKLGRSNSNTQQ